MRWRATPMRLVWLTRGTPHGGVDHDSDVDADAPTSSGLATAGDGQRSEGSAQPCRLGGARQDAIHRLNRLVPGYPPF
jgi:hypothetical protein